MAISIRWDNNEQTVILCEYIGNWTWDEFFESGQKAIDMQEQINHKVD